MNEALRLARRDLRGGLGGLSLLWLCLAIAVAAIASVTSLASSINHAIATNGRAMIGGDLVIRSAQHPASAAELTAMHAMGRVSASITTRAMLIGPSGDPALVELSSVDQAWPLAGSLALQAGGARPHGDTIAIGSDVADRLSIKRGDRVRIGDGMFTVGGIIDAMPAMSNFALAPPVLVDAVGLARTGLIQPGSIATNSYRLLLPTSVDPQAAGKTFQTRFPDGGWQVGDRKDAGSGTRRFVDRVAELLLLVALAALVVGGLGIASATSAFAESRRATVATLKLLGAGRRTLAVMLASEVGAIATLAILAGLIIGAVVPSLAAGLATALPVAPDPSPQWAALAEAGLFGLLVTLGAAWGPLAAAVGTRPATLIRGDTADDRARRRQIVPIVAWALAAALAIASATDPRVAGVGVGAVALLALIFAGLGLFLRRLARAFRHSGGPVTRLGVAALDRPGAATVRLSVALGLGLALLVTLAAVAQSLLREIDDDVPTRAPALFLIDIPADRRLAFEQLAHRMLPAADNRMVPSLRGPVTAVNGVAVADMKAVPEGAWILRGDRGLTFAADLPAGNRITSGNWWPADYRGPPLISIDQDAATALKLKVGDRMTIAVLGRPIEARIASLRSIDWRSMGFNFAIIFAPGTLEQAPFTLMATVSPPPGTKTLQFERALATQLPMVSAIRVADVIAQVRTLLVALAGAVRIATGVALLLGIIVLAGAVVATRRSRARDLVLLKLVGATRRDILATQMIEFSILGLAVTMAAFAAGMTAAYAVVAMIFDLSFRPDWMSLGGLAVGSVMVTVVAALAAVMPALRARPAEALRSL